MKTAEQKKATYRRWAVANQQHLRDREALRRLTKRAMCLVATSRTRARKRGMLFDLHEHTPEIQRRIDRGACELTGVPFDLSPGRKFNSPSIDRINPKLGYTYDNVRIVLNLINAALGDWGEDVLVSVITQWRAKKPSTK